MDARAPKAMPARVRAIQENALMRNSLLAAVAAIALAVPAAAQNAQPTTPQTPMPSAPPGLGERITSGMQTPEPPFPAAPPAASATIAPSRLNAGQIRQIQQGLRTA